MATYATSAGVAPRAGNRPLTETSKPSTTDVDGWLNEAEGELLGAFAAAGIATTYTAGSQGANILRGWIEGYVAGLLRVSYAAAAGAGANADGQEQVREWRDRLLRIGRDPAHFSAMLGTGSASNASIGLSSHIQDSSLGLEAADYAPTFLSPRNDSRNY